MASLIANREFDLSSLLSDKEFFLHAVTPRYVYENGEKTDALQGFVYDATGTETYEHIKVLVESTKPLIPSEVLAQKKDAGEKVFVTFDGAVVKTYYNSQIKGLADSIKATSVKLVHK